MSGWCGHKAVVLQSGSVGSCPGGGRLAQLAGVSRAGAQGSQRREGSAEQCCYPTRMAFVLFNERHSERAKAWYQYTGAECARRHERTRRAGAAGGQVHRGPRGGGGGGLLVSGLERGLQRPQAAAGGHVAREEQVGAHLAGVRDEAVRR